MSLTSEIYPVILSGGAGTRLWPLSRALNPKQFLALAGDQGLFEQTLERISEPRLFAPPLVVCNAEHRFLVGEALRRHGMTPKAILLEPLARNTAPAVCVAAFKLAAIIDMRHPLVHLGGLMPWADFDESFGRFYKPLGRPAKPCQRRSKIPQNVE